MRKANRRPQRLACMAPMIVMRGIRNDEMELRERTIIDAFTLGYADAEHFDHLADMQGLLILAGSTSEKRRPAAEYARDVFGPVIGRIKARYVDTGALTCDEADLPVLRGFVTLNREFWLRQPTELYLAAVKALQAHNDKLIATRKAEKEAA